MIKCLVEENATGIRHRRAISTSRRGKPVPVRFRKFLGLRLTTIQRMGRPLTSITVPALDHIMAGHVNVSDRESLQQNKSVFNANWLLTIDNDSRAALGKIAKHVVDNGDYAPTPNAVDDDYYDYYFNFDQKVGWQETAEGIVWLKGVIVRGKLSNDVMKIETMFPKSVLFK